MHAALSADRFVYAGLIGSDTNRARSKRRLSRAGVDEDKPKSLVCPSGVVGMSTREFARMAVATELMVWD